MAQGSEKILNIYKIINKFVAAINQKEMTRIPYIATILSLMAVFACAELPEGNDENTTSKFSLGAKEMAFDYLGGEQTISITAPGEWTAKCSDSDWCTVSPAKGSGDADIKVKVQVIPEESLDRNTRILVTSGDLTLSVSVSQTCNPETFIITPNQVSIDSQEQDFQITVVSHSYEYDITIVDDWISEVSRSGEALTGQTITFHATSNTNLEGNSRSGVISVCTKEGNCYPVMVEQSGGFSRKVLGMRFTATWCGYCPYMDEAFHSAAEQSQDFIYVTFHASSGYPLYFKDSEPLVSAYHIDGYPTGVLGGWKTINNSTNTSTTTKSILNAINSFNSKFPVSAAVSASATLNGGTISVDASVAAPVTDDLKIVALVLESGIVKAQAYYPTSGGSKTLNDFVHDYVARKTLTGSILGDAFTGGKQFHWETSLDSSWNKDNLSVLVWLYKDYGDLASEKAKKNYPDNYIVNACCVKISE